jgi:hypothetical protein
MIPFRTAMAPSRRASPLKVKELLSTMLQPLSGSPTSTSSLPVTMSATVGRR